MKCPTVVMIFVERTINKTPSRRARDKACIEYANKLVLRCAQE
jgi:hypothetical protein